MKKEEQIEQLRVQLLAYNDTVCFTESKLNGLRANRQVVIDQLEQLEKSNNEEGMSEGAKKFMSAMRSAIYSPILDFNDVVITSYLDSFGKITDFRDAIPVKSLYEDSPTIQFLGYNSNSKKYIFCSNRNGQLHKGMPTNMLFFGKKIEKPLKHPHMKDIVSIGCLKADMSIDFGRGEESIDWNEWDKVQIVGVDKQYGIVVKATEKKEDPNQFTLFFCKKK